MRCTPLSDTDRRRFEEDGFLILRGVLDRDQVERLAAAGDRLVASGERQGRQSQDHGRYDGFRNVIARDPVFLDLLTHEATLPLVIQLMSPNLQLHTSHLIYKASEGLVGDPRRRDPGWHRDINTSSGDVGNAHICRLEIKVAYQLSDALAPDCGQTLFARGSHRLHQRPRLIDDIDPEHLVVPLLAPGDVVLFENRTFHAGSPNRSPHTRKTLMMGYSYDWLRPDDYSDQADTLLERCDPIGRQLLSAARRTTAADGTFIVPNGDRPLGRWAREHGLLPGWQMADRLGLGDLQAC